MRIILSLLFIFFTANVNASINWSKYEFFENAGGLNDAFSPIVIEDNESPDLQNVVFTTSGNWKTRGGSAKLNSSAVGTSWTGIKYYSPTSGSKFLVSINSSTDKIYKMDYSGGGGPDGTWDDITGALSISVGQNNLASFAVGEDELIIEDGVNTTAPYKWTGSSNAVALGGTPPNGTMVAYHKRMAFIAGNNTNPSTLYFSDVGDIENWSTGLSGNVSIETNDGTVIRAIIPGFDALYIFKDKSIWRLTGDDKDTFVLQRMVSDIGTLSPRGVSLIGNQIWFVSDQGNVYLYDGSLTVKRISTKIEGTLSESNFARFQYVITESFDDDFYMTIATSGSSTNDRLMYFDTFNQAWSKFKGLNVNALSVADDGNGEDMIIFGDYSGYTYKYPSGTDDAGTSIDTYYITKQYRFPQSAPLKDWKLLRIFANQKGNYNLSVELRTNFATSGSTQTVSLLGEGSLYGTAVYGVDKYGGQNLIIGRIEPNTEGDFFQIKFSQSTQPIEVKGWQIFVEDQDRI